MSEFSQLLRFRDPRRGAGPARSRMRMMGIWLLLSAIFGCGGAEPVPATHRDFASIQRHEATIFGSQGDLDGPCEGVSGAQAEICQASASICLIAEDTGDLDARSRCDRAAEQCVRAEARFQECAN